jgi:hypothetical protein
MTRVGMPSTPRGRPSIRPSHVDRATGATPALQQRDPRAIGHRAISQLAISYRLNNDTKNCRGGFPRSPQWTKQHAKRLSSLGSQLQPPNRTRPRASRRPRQCDIAGPRSERLLKRPESLLGTPSLAPRWGLPRWRLGHARSHNEHSLEHRPMCAQRRCIRLQRRSYPNTPTRRRPPRQCSKRRKQEI